MAATGNKSCFLYIIMDKQRQDFIINLVLTYNKLLKEDAINMSQEERLYFLNTLKKSIEQVVDMLNKSR